MSSIQDMCLLFPQGFPGQPHSPDFNHCVIFDPKVTGSLVTGLGCPSDSDNALGITLMCLINRGIRNLISLKPRVFPFAPRVNI